MLCHYMTFPAKPIIDEIIDPYGYFGQFVFSMSAMTSIYSHQSYLG